jgi:hypothetical protein
MMEVLKTRKTIDGAEGGSRTHTTLRSTDFKSVASAIPPPRHRGVKSHVIKHFQAFLTLHQTGKDDVMM